MRVRRRQSRRARPGCRDATLMFHRARRHFCGPKVRRERRASLLIDLVSIITLTATAAEPAAAPGSACAPASRGGARAQERPQMEEVRCINQQCFNRRWIKHWRM